MSGTHCVVTLTIVRTCTKIRTFYVFKISSDLLNIQEGYWSTVLRIIIERALFLRIASMNMCNNNNNNNNKQWKIFSQSNISYSKYVWYQNPPEDILPRRSLPKFLWINKFPHIFYSCHAVLVLTALTICGG